MSHFRSGGLALIIGGSIPANIGKTVTLVEAIPPGEHQACGHRCINHRSVTAWVCSGDGLIAHCRDRMTGETHYRPGDLILVSQSNLMPLDGDQVAEREKEEAL